MITIASTWGHPSCSRSRGSTPGPQSSRTRPDPSTRYPDCAPPGFGQAGEHPTTVSFTFPVWHSPRVAEGAGESPQAGPDLLRPGPEGAGADRRVHEGAHVPGRRHRHLGGSERGRLLRDRGAARPRSPSVAKSAARLGPGDYFGEVALLNESARTATITAESDLSCYGLTSWEFRPLVETHGSIAWKLLQAMSKTYQSRRRSSYAGPVGELDLDGVALAVARVRDGDRVAGPLRVDRRAQLVAGADALPVDRCVITSPARRPARCAGVFARHLLISRRPAAGRRCRSDAEESVLGLAGRDQLRRDRLDGVGGDREADAFVAARVALRSER